MQFPRSLFPHRFYFRAIIINPSNWCHIIVMVAQPNISGFWWPAPQKNRWLIINKIYVVRPHCCGGWLAPKLTIDHLSITHPPRDHHKKRLFLSDIRSDETPGGFLGAWVGQWLPMEESRSACEIFGMVSLFASWRCSWLMLTPVRNVFQWEKPGELVEMAIPEKWSSPEIGSMVEMILSFVE